MKYRYYILLLGIFGLGACQSYDNPIDTPHANKTVKSESKFSVDIANSNLSTLIYQKQFDVKGNLSEYKEFTNSGSLQVLSIFTYDELESKEQKSVYDETGNVSSVDNFIYLFLGDGKIKEKHFLDDSGKITIKEIFNYDPNGNLLKKVTVNQESQVSYSAEYSYKYSNSGDLVERITNESTDIGTIQSRDSISYRQQDNKLEIFKYNSNGNILNIKTLFYNENGLVSIETESDANGVLKVKYAYRYEYYE